MQTDTLTHDGPICISRLEIALSGDVIDEHDVSDCFYENDDDGDEEVDYANAIDPRARKNLMNIINLFVIVDSAVSVTRCRNKKLPNFVIKLS